MATPLLAAAARVTLKRFATVIAGRIVACAADRVALALAAQAKAWLAVVPPIIILCQSQAQACKDIIVFNR
jgi:hypothetical protein